MHFGLNHENDPSAWTLQNIKCKRSKAQETQARINEPTRFPENWLIHRNCPKPWNQQNVPDQIDFPQIDASINKLLLRKHRKWFTRISVGNTIVPSLFFFIFPFPRSHLASAARSLVYLESYRALQNRMEKVERTRNSSARVSEYLPLGVHSRL